MKLGLFLILGSIVILCLFLNRTKRKIAYSLICVLTLCFCLYMFNTDFKETIDMKINTVQQHVCRIDNETYYIPLPEKSILKYRFSDSGAAYKTILSGNEVINFFENLEQCESKYNFEENIMLVSCDGVKYEITIEFLNGETNYKITGSL